MIHRVDAIRDQDVSCDHYDGDRDDCIESDKFCFGNNRLLDQQSKSINEKSSIDWDHDCSFDCIDHRETKN